MKMSLFWVCRIFSRLSLVAIVLSFSCAPLVGQVVEVVGLLSDGSDEFGLKKVKLQNIKNLAALEGNTFLFLTGLELAREEYIEVFETSTSFNDARNKILSSARLSPIKLQLSYQSTHSAALDFDSLYLLTAYFLFESVESFYNDIFSPRFASQAVVSVYGSFTSLGSVRVPSAFFDNSSYVPLIDVFKIYRVADQKGVPYGMNPGVIAHEFHHRVFHQKVFESQGQTGFETWKNLNTPHFSVKNTRPRILIRAVDEGLADLFAVAFLGKTQFMKWSSPSYSMSGADDLRDLNGEFAHKATYDNLAHGSIEKKFLEPCGNESINFTNTNFQFYCLGTVIAASVWDASQHDVSVLRSDFIRPLGKGLSKFGLLLGNDLQQFDLHLFWESVVCELEEKDAAALCHQLRWRFAGLFDRINSCHGV